MFSSTADMLEDIMQASVPGIIENVRVAEINQGSNPLRILSLRALPDTHMGDLKNAIHEENKKTKDPQEAAADEKEETSTILRCHSLTMLLQLARGLMTRLATCTCS